MTVPFLAMASKRARAIIVRPISTGIATTHLPQLAIRFMQRAVARGIFL